MCARCTTSVFLCFLIRGGVQKCTCKDLHKKRKEDTKQPAEKASKRVGEKRTETDERQQQLGGCHTRNMKHSNPLAQPASVPPLVLVNRRKTLARCNLKQRSRALPRRRDENGKKRKRESKKHKKHEKRMFP